MRGLSLTQPWASLVAFGAKRWETRGWSTSYRGQVAIHASKGFPNDCKEMCFWPPFNDGLASGGITTLRAMPLGAILAVADLVGCHRTCCAPWVLGPIHGAIRTQPAAHEGELGDYADGRFFFELDNVRCLREPIQYKGALGLWAIPEDVVAQINAAVSA